MDAKATNYSPSANTQGEPCTYTKVTSDDEGKIVGNETLKYIAIGLVAYILLSK